MSVTEADREAEAFKREERYIVIKRKQLSAVQEPAIRAHMARLGIGTVECVVVEHDWPEYETVWGMIEDRVTGTARHRTATTAALTAEIQRLREGAVKAHNRAIYLAMRVVVEVGELLAENLANNQPELAKRFETLCDAVSVKIAEILPDSAALSTTSEVSEPVADEAEMAAFGASEAAAIYYPGEDQQAERLAFCAGAAHAVSTPNTNGDAVREAASFLVERLHELEGDLGDDSETIRQFYGHIVPARARLEDALATLAKHGGAEG